MTFLACRAYENGAQTTHRIEKMSIESLSKGEVLINVCYSGINYKDALAATGRGQILKHFPLNVGIDLAGEVESSTDPRFEVGDKVLVNGCGLGEKHDGGLAEKARVPANWVMPVPDGLTMRECMILGTAGFTAALAIHRMAVNGQSVDKGPIVVTGASGGVGSFAVNILSNLGYDVTAVSGREELFDYLTELGATQVCSADELGLGSKPLEKARFGGVIDNVGGNLLSQLIAHTNLWGNVACIGLADNHKLDTTVFPLILRGVSLLGVSSTNCTMPLRKEIWSRMGKELKPNKFGTILTQEVKLREVSCVFDQLLDRKKHGRILVDCRA
ncbi:YhdH/YhfP family quinone oxidoreductase [Aliikangiella sp. IMCC44359]|uniref:YhdH/YhfP family quinone oxidoreductase n=1 Tax=Aliikangiella sp. IMCC44359 TaxID=3459125 RepID=UPI00403AE59F